MADAAAKRIREARKRRKKEIKAERKRQRKEGDLLKSDDSDYYLPGENRPAQGPEDALRQKKAAEARERAARKKDREESESR